MKTLIIHAVITISTIVVSVFFASLYLTNSDSILGFLVTNIAAPAYIGYRVAKAPTDSGVFAISWIVSFVVAFLLFAFVVSCKFSVHCNLYLFLIGLVYIFSGYLCVFTKKAP